MTGRRRLGILPLVTTRRLTALALVALTTLVLSACTRGVETPDDVPTDAATQTDPTGEPSTEPSEAETGGDEVDLTTLPECEGIALEEGAVVDGEVLADCMAAAMIEAGSGSHRLDSYDGVTEVDFTWNPEIALHARGAVEYVIRGDEGWMLIDGRWVRGDSTSSDPDEVFAASVLELSRAFGDPRGMVLMFNQTAWEVLGEDAVPASDAVRESGWHLVPQGQLTLLGVTLSDVELWLGEDHLGIYFVGTGQFGGVSATSSNTFTQWGGPVEIPDPAAG